MRTKEGGFPRIILGFILTFSVFGNVYAQTCTIISSGSWVSGSPPACSEGGDADDPGITTIIIPAGITLDFDDNGDTWTGTQIQILGGLDVTAPGQVTINSSILVKDGGILSISSKLNLGSSSGCGYNLVVEEGGTVDIVGSTPDRLNICGQEIARGGSAGCNPYPDGPTPYCEPSGGFTGPMALDEGGDNSSLLPVELLSFKAVPAENVVLLFWETATELNNDYFTIEKSYNGFSYHEIGKVAGFGTTKERQRYEFVDQHPFNGLNYYRLIQTDFDGTAEMFRPVSAYFDGKPNNVVLFPNPIANDNLHLVVSNLKSSSLVTVYLCDFNGREIYTSSFMTNVVGGLEEKINVSSLSSGYYFLKLVGGLNLSFHRILVK